MFTRGRRESGGGFFEVFSDLIFGVMAIFVLLFVIIISQVNPEEKKQPAVDLVFAIDVSASMGKPLAELKRSVIELAENFPTVVRDFRMGAVVYAEWVNSNGMDVFPLTSMDDAGKRKIIQWLEQTTQKSGLVDTNKAIQTAVNLLSGDPDDSRRRSLVLIGDVGPFELRGQNRIRVDNTSPPDTTTNQVGINTVADFVSNSEENRLLVYFPGSERFETENGLERRWAYSESRSFFCEIAKSADRKGSFIEQDGQLMWSLLASFIKVEDLEDTETPTC